MINVLKILLVLILAVLSTNRVLATTAVPVVTGELPASFEGVLPCGNCEGIETRITLRPDNTYFMSKTYLGKDGPNKSNDLGRWLISQFGKILILKGQRSEIQYFRYTSPNELTMLDLDARTIFSPLNYTLSRAKNVAEFNLKLFPLNGLFKYQADAGRFKECVSGLDFPVAQSGENAKLEAAYSAQALGAGQAIFASVYGHIKPMPNAEGNRIDPTLIPLRFESIDTNTTCLQRLKSAALQDQAWNLVQINGKPVVLSESQRAPGLMFHSDNQRMSGSSGCNQLLGTYKVNANTLDIGLMAATRMACLFEGNIEQEFTSTLAKVKTWNILGQRLELYDQLGGVLARFEAD